MEKKKYDVFACVEQQVQKDKWDNKTICKRVRTEESMRAFKNDLLM